METEEEVKKLEEQLNSLDCKQIESPIEKKWLKDKEGNKLSFKEYMSKWKSGIEGITPLQRTKAQLSGTRIMLLGLFLGLIMSLIGYKTLWWVAIILVGGIINTSIQYIAQKQQLEIYKNIENQLKGGEESDGI